MTHTTDFVLRPFLPDDLDALVEHASHPTVAANLTDAFPNPFTEEAGRTFIDHAMNGPALRRCIAINGSCAGALGLHPKEDLWRHNLELGYWLAFPYRGRGIMTEAIRQLTDAAGERAVPGAALGLVSGFGMVAYDRCLCTGAVILGRSS